MMDQPDQGSEQGDGPPTDDRGEARVFRYSRPARWRLTDWIWLAAWCAFVWVFLGPEFRHRVTMCVYFCALPFVFRIPDAVRARRASVLLDGEGVTERDWLGRERRVRWTDITEVLRYGSGGLLVKARNAYGPLDLSLQPGLEDSYGLGEAIAGRVGLALQLRSRPEERFGLTLWSNDRAAPDRYAGLGRAVGRALGGAAARLRHTISPRRP